jgi:hypothetical protein
MEALMVFLAIVAALVLLDAAAVAFGAESRESFVDPGRPAKF